MPTATVIGAGFSGIAMALRLRARGYEVTVLDRQPAPGGRARVLEVGGYAIDAGPTVITAPQLLEELFTLYGKEMKNYVSLIRLKEFYHFRFADGTQFAFHDSLEQTCAGLGAEAAGFRKLLAFAAHLHALAFEKLADQPFCRFRDMLRYLPAFIRLKSYRSVWQMTGQYLRDRKVRMACSVAPLLLGGNPLTTTSLYLLILELERKYGVWHAEGGMDALVAALTTLCTEAGCAIRPGQEVTYLRKESPGWKVHTQQEVYTSDIVVYCGDPARLYSTLLEQDIAARLCSKLLHLVRKPSMGVFVLCFVTDREFATVPHHTILFAPEFEASLKEVFAGKTLPSSPNIYLHRPRATDSTLAPEGTDLMYALVPVPHLGRYQRWEQEGEGFRQALLQLLEQHLLPDLSKHLLASRFLTPVDFAQEYGASYGSAFGLQPLFYQSAWFRSHNRSPFHTGLYLAGAGTHPGAGIPGVLCSAKVTDHLIAADRERKQA